MEGALTLARTGDSARARAKTDDLEKQLPCDTLLKRYWLPTIRAVIEINRTDPSKAIELLKGNFWTIPVWLRTPPYPWPMLASLTPIPCRERLPRRARRIPILKEAKAEFAKLQ
jgi:hypothetical protein